MDIDIDIRPDFSALKLFQGNVVGASMVLNDDLVKHPVGVYFQRMAVDPISKLAAIPYKEAEEIGFFKIDFLHLNVLNHFESKEQMDELLEQEPDWKLLEEREIVEKLFQIADHFEIVYAVKPKSVLELSDILALIRPNKRKLLDKYLRNKTQIRKELYTRRDKTDMRKSHTIPYALLIVLQLHMIKMGKI